MISNRYSIDFNQPSRNIKVEKIMRAADEADEPADEADEPADEADEPDDEADEPAGAKRANGGIKMY